MKTKDILLGLLFVIIYFPLALGQERGNPFSVNPLTGMQAKAEGLSYSDVKAELLPSGMPLLSPSIRLGQSLEIIMTEPKGFVEENGLIYFGTSIRIKQSDSDKVLADLGDIYGATAQGFEPDFVRSLKAKVSLTEGTYMKSGSMIDIEVTFFDKKGSGKVVVTLPNMVLGNGQAASSYASREYKPGVELFSNFGDTLGGQLKAGGGELNSLLLLPGQSLSFHTTAPFTKEELASLQLRSSWFSWKGEMLESSEAALRKGSDANNLIVDIPMPSDTAAYGLDLCSISLLHPATGKALGLRAWIAYGDTAQAGFGEEVAEKLAVLSGHYHKSGQKAFSYILMASGLELHASSKENLYQQGTYLIKDGDVYQGISMLEQAVLMDSAYFDAHFALGLAYKSKRDYSDALRHLTICTELQPDHYQSLFQTGWLHNEKGHYQRALIVLNKAVRYNYEMDGKVYYERAFANRKLQFYEQAALDYEKYTALAPNDFSGHYYKGFTYIDLQKYDRALIALKKAVQIDPENYDALYEWGFALKKMGEYEEAIDKFNRAAALSSGTVLYGKIVAHKGDCLIELGRNAEACEAYQDAVANGYKAGVHLLEQYCR